MIRTLNGIRALLFIFIFSAHFKYITINSMYGSTIFKLFNIARFAVLSFFLLSGFCIALGYSDKFNKYSENLYCDFLIKRFIRIYPLYILTIIINWIINNVIGNPVGWFADVIFICYIFTPIALWVFNKTKRLRHHIIFCLINYIILAVFSIYLVLIHQPNHEFYYRFYLIRIFEYLIALDIGFIYLKKLKNNLNFEAFNNYFYKSVIDFIYIIIFILIMYVLPNNLLYRHVIGIPVICSFIIFMCIEKRSILYDIFSSKFFNFLGNISYECYMIHILVLTTMTPYAKYYLSAISKIIIFYVMALILTIVISIIYKKAILLIKKQYKAIINKK